MTTDNNWTEKVYLDSEWQAFQSRPLRKNEDAEYIRADKVKDLQLAAIRATLESAFNESSDAGGDWAAILQINPQEILEKLDE